MKLTLPPVLTRTGSSPRCSAWPWPSPSPLARGSLRVTRVKSVDKRAILLSAPAPVVKIATDDMSPGLSFLSWDTEGGEKAATNLLRAGSAVRVQYLAGASEWPIRQQRFRERLAGREGRRPAARQRLEHRLPHARSRAGPPRVAHRNDERARPGRHRARVEDPARTDRLAQPHGLRPRRRPDRPWHAPSHLPLRPQGHLDDRPPGRMARRRDLPPPRGHQRSRLGPDAPRGGERASGRRPPRRLAHRARPST